MAEVHSDLNSLSKWYLLFLCGASFLLPWSQRFFLIFLRERDQEQAAKRRQRVAKETRRKRKTFANLCQRQLSNLFRAEKRSAQASAHPLSQAQGGLFCVLTAFVVAFVCCCFLQSILQKPYFVI